MVTHLPGPDEGSIEGRNWPPPVTEAPIPPALERVYDETVLGWARVLELRNAETEGHSQRVASLAADLARRLGLTDDAVRWVWRGAILHDVGKMAIPDHVLMKPGPLTEDERALIETHPLLARELLEPLRFLRPCLNIPLYHHERWDGLGYPIGLSEYSIPQDARLFSVVDVYDALTSDRPYREAWTVQAALDYIVDASGTQFDPAIVRAFVALIKGSSSMH